MKWFDDVTTATRGLRFPTAPGAAGGGGGAAAAAVGFFLLDFFLAI